MKKKGQLLGQPLVYLFALVAGAMILIWGIRTVIQLGDTAATVEIGKFASKLQSDVSQYLNFDEGSATEIKVALPSKITHICFLDATSEKKCILDGKPCDIDKLDDAFAAMASTRTKNNFFFLPMGAYKLPPKEIKNLRVDTATGNPICFRNNANKKFTLTSMGTYVSVN